MCLNERLGEVVMLKPMTQRRKTKQESLLVLSLVVAVVGHCGDSDGATLEGLALKVNAGREVRARRVVNAQSFF